MSKIAQKPPIVFRIVLLFMLVSFVVGLCVLLPRRITKETTVDLVGLPVTPAQGFQRVTGPVPLRFPLDQGAHPEYQTEWWYYTGNLVDEAGNRFGYQLTFFRRGIVPSSDEAAGMSAWRTTQVYFAHFALTDVTREQFAYRERFSRGAAGLAGAQGEPTFSVWLENWSVQQIDDATYRLEASSDGMALELTLTDHKGFILQGDRGYSPKGTEEGNASIYISETRLESSGMLSLNGATYTVKGWSWMDHEFSTSALGPGQVGWDWYSIQFDDGSELMLFNLRDAQGQPDAFAAGTWIAADGSTRSLTREDFAVTVTSTWKSPHSGASYPAGWQVRVLPLGLDFNIQPLLADQELNTSFTYWEGAVSVQGSREGVSLNGYGYVELTGYKQSMQGQF